MRAARSTDPLAKNGAGLADDEELAGGVPIDGPKVPSGATQLGGDRTAGQVVEDGALVADHPDLAVVGSPDAIEVGRADVRIGHIRDQLAIRAGGPDPAVVGAEDRADVDSARVDEALERADRSKP